MNRTLVRAKYSILSHTDDWDDTLTIEIPGQPALVLWMGRRNLYWALDHDEKIVMNKLMVGPWERFNPVTLSDQDLDILQGIYQKQQDRSIRAR